MKRLLNIKSNLSLGARIFLAMTVIVVITFILISLITIPQFKTQSDKYHSKRLERKEAQIQRSIAYFSKEARHIWTLSNLIQFCLKKFMKFPMYKV